ncbi:MAG TPA: hypothetical protein VFB22_05880 [Candidatus Baltobacteraceae bacterium]|nr:hypothetical protein [Candidatus Baltobacteraceae bacterium]
MIDRWFPVAAVDKACKTPVGSGMIEKAMFTWFASRPLAQARAAALTTLLPEDDASKALIERAIVTGDKSAFDALTRRVVNAYHGQSPVVLDMFSGRGIIPLEASRAGAAAIAFDLSPVATLAGKLLTDYPARDWSDEPALGFPDAAAGSSETFLVEDRLTADVGMILGEVNRRVCTRVASLYPVNSYGDFPWAYLWSVTIPCDECARRFPLLGSLVLRHPHKKNRDAGESMSIILSDDSWSIEILDGPPSQQPTYAAGTRSDGKKKKGKSARCPFCGTVHPLESVKAKGIAGQYQDVLLLVVDTDDKGKRYFRKATDLEKAVAADPPSQVVVVGPYSAIPDEKIPDGNVHTVMASGYGYRSFGDLMCRRQSLFFAITAKTIAEVCEDLRQQGASLNYVQALAGYAASVLCRRLRFATRGARLKTEGDSEGLAGNNVRAGDVFTNESKINFQFDFLEIGPGEGPGTWMNLAGTTIKTLAKLRRDVLGRPVRVARASATALPLRDASIDVVITDPPYYDMIEYADASDLFHVWLKRTLYDLESDLFGPDVQGVDGLQDKNDEIIVRRVHEPGRVRHDTAFYESMLAQSFGEARRVLKPNGHLVVMFGHSDPDAWRRLLGALQSAGFVVTSAWPSRTESANTGVASIKVTVTIGCRVAAPSRPTGIASEVDREVVEAVVERVHRWDADGLALEDQLMASYGPAMEVYGKYGRVINPDGSSADLDHYLALARRAVRDAMRLRVDELPLETFDAVTRFAMFWLRAKGRSEVPKGEARFFAQADELRLDDLRGRILSETKAGFQLRLQDGTPLTEHSSMFEVVRRMAHVWDAGGMEAVAEAIVQAGLEANNQHLWAVVGDLATHLPASDKTAKALAGIKRSATSVAMLVGNARGAAKQSDLFDSVEA